MRPVIPISARRLRMNFGLYPCTSRIHTTPLVSKSVKEKISQVADKVNKKVGEGLASAIETGEKATEKTKETLGSTTKRTKGKVEGGKEGAGQMTQKAEEARNDVASGAKETGRNAKKDA